MHVWLCCQLAQPILKKGGWVTSKKGGIGEVGGCHPLAEGTWLHSWLAVEIRPWLALAVPFLSCLAKTGVETTPTCVGYTNSFLC